MVAARSPTFRVRVRGDLACFTRPELKVERVSYPVMTPSAARGVLDAVLWKPAVLWHVERIHVLQEIRFIAFRRNEVNNKAVAPPAAVIRDGGPAPSYMADLETNRAQRNTVALRDVDYLVEAHLSMTERAGPEDNAKKFEEMFLRRVEKGQYFHHPYLGCREFPAEVSTAENAPAAIAEDRPLGLMLWDVLHEPSGKRPVFFSASLRKGVLEVPPDAEAAMASALAAQGGTA